ncbi:glycosyltransferase family 4 protein [candidate division KSB1 bacterium]|nr:glycosyltransferase family 4 protein [candidate division KSB1 bacterium]
MKVAVLSPIAWRTPPRHYGPWEQIASLITEGLVARGVDVTLFATGDSLTGAKLEYVAEKSWEENKNLDPKVWECLHISHLMEQAHRFDIIHNHFDFLPLTYSKLIKTPVLTTIHGFSSPEIIPVFKRYNDSSYYVAISQADKNPELNYIATVYHGVDTSRFTFKRQAGKYLIFFGRIHHDKGTSEAIQIAQRVKLPLIISGIIQDENYFLNKVKPFIDGMDIKYIGSSGPQQRDELLGNAVALLHPINFNEPFGLSVVESMLCGTPVIAFNRGAMPELIQHEKTGFLVNSIDEAVSAVRNVKEINRIDCRRWAESKFSHNRMVDDYLKVYHEILK